MPYIRRVEQQKKQNKMELEKKHRQALLSELSKAKDELESSNNCLNSNESDGIKEFFEISSFLAQQKINLIEQSLIDNGIDF